MQNDPTDKKRAATLVETGEASVPKSPVNPGQRVQPLASLSAR